MKKTDFPDGITVAEIPSGCEVCGQPLVEAESGPFQTPPPGWIALQTNFFDGAWPPVQAMNSIGGNTMLFCSGACASDWVARWYRAATTSRLPDPEPEIQADDPPRYFQLRLAPLAGMPRHHRFGVPGDSERAATPQTTTEPDRADLTALGAKSTLNHHPAETASFANTTLVWWYCSWHSA